MSTESRLRWRCRRGILELELLLGGFLDRRLGALTEAECAVLEHLLKYPDQQLMAYLYGQSVPTDEETRQLVAKIRATAS